MSGGFGSSDQLSRRVTELERKINQINASTAAGIVAGMGSFSLATSGTSTAVTDANVTGSSVILLVAGSADGWSIDAGISGITPAAGSFTVTHTASSLTRTFSYVVINPA